MLNTGRRELTVAPLRSAVKLYNKSPRWASTQASRPRTAIFFPGMIQLVLLLASGPNNPQDKVCKELEC